MSGALEGIRIVDLTALGMGARWKLPATDLVNRSVRIGLDGHYA